MSKYTISIKRTALKELKSLPKYDAIRVLKAIENLSENPRPTECKKLKGFDALWRIRSGNYRVIYRIEDKILFVEVLKVVGRKDAY